MNNPVYYSGGVGPLILNLGTRGTEVDYQLRAWLLHPG